MTPAVFSIALVALVAAACNAGAAPSSSPVPSPVPSPTPVVTPSPSPNPTQTPGAGVVGRTFLSTGVTKDGQPFQLVAGTRIRLAFQPNDLSASAGCNIIGGQYRVSDGRLVFTGGSMTEMACPDGRDAQDQWLISILSSRPLVTLDGNDLRLATADVTITLLDREIAEPDQPLVGTGWIVVGLIDGDSVSSMPVGVFATISFDASGGVAVDTGCNTGSARWSGGDGSITITGLSLTKKACGPPAGDVERAIVAVLGSGALQVSIDAYAATMAAGSRGLQLQAPGPD